MDFKKKVLSVVMSFMMLFMPVLCVSAHVNSNVTYEKSQTVANKGAKRKSTASNAALQVFKMWLGFKIIQSSPVLLVKIGQTVGSMIMSLDLTLGLGVCFADLMALSIGCVVISGAVVFCAAVGLIASGASG